MDPYQFLVLRILPHRSVNYSMPGQRRHACAQQTGATLIQTSWGETRGMLQVGNLRTFYSLLVAVVQWENSPLVRDVNKACNATHVGVYLIGRVQIVRSLMQTISNKLLHAEKEKHACCTHGKNQRQKLVVCMKRFRTH